MLWQNRPNTTAIRARELPLLHDCDADESLHCDEALYHRCHRYPYRPAITAGSRDCSHRPVIDSNPAGESQYSLLHGLISPPSPPPRRSSPHSRKRQFVVRAMPLRSPPFGGLSKTVGLDTALGNPEHTIPSCGLLAARPHLRVANTVGELPSADLFCARRLANPGI